MNIMYKVAYSKSIVHIAQEGTHDIPVQNAQKSVENAIVFCYPYRGNAPISLHKKPHQ